MFRLRYVIILPYGNILNSCNCGLGIIIACLFNVIDISIVRINLRICDNLNLKRSFSLA